MKIFKHEFYESNLVVIDGEIAESDPTIYEAYFSLTTKSLLLFEEEYGKPLLTAITSIMPKGKVEEENINIDTEIIRALACSCYLKIDHGKIVLNELTKNEFKSSPMNELCLVDVEFINDILQLAMDCLTQKQSKASNGASDKKK